MPCDVGVGPLQTTFGVCHLSLFHLLGDLEECARLFASRELSLSHVNTHEEAMEVTLNNQVDRISQPIDVSQPLSVTTPVLAQWLTNGAAMVVGVETVCGFNSMDFASPRTI